MPASSRSAARVWGTCGVTSPWRRSQSFRYRWLSRTPSSRSTTRATRGAVHRPVANPYAVGLRPRKPSVAAAWSGDSLGGRPRPGLAANAASPPPRWAATHRQTDRSLTPRNSATSSGGHPSATRSTAIRLTRSNDSAVLGISMHAIITRVRFY